MQFWLFKTVATLLGRLAQPTLIILEDLQWVGSESIAMLERLVPVTSTVPLLILGIYRNDERPDLPEWLPGMAVYTLDRLDEPAIADLSMSMLGEAGRDPQVVSLLQRESEGNAFFLIEVVRALAEEAGTLDRIALITLPARVFAGGIRDVVQRRLRRVPTWARPLLNLAAMAGREIDVALMVALNGRSIASWLTTCASAAVLEQPEDRWRFTHDKLREGVLEELSDDERPALHRQVAEALENVYDEDPHQIPALAYHYQHAQIRDKAIHYLTQAGHNARTSYANEEALTFYKHAVDQVTPLLEEKTEPEKWSGVMGELEESLGAVLLLMARRADAQSAFQRALAQVPENDRIWQSRLYRKMAKILEEQRYLEDALQIYNIALAKLGDEQCEPVSIWWQEWIENQVEHMRMYYWLGKLHEAEELAEQMKPVVEQQGTPEQRGKFFNSLALTGIRRERYVPSDLTVSYARSAVVAIQESDNLVETVWIQFIFGFVLLWYGALDEAEEELRKAQALTERVGDVTTLCFTANRVEWTRFESTVHAVWPLPSRAT
jgi:tetratricopeptide (TPR) repeat protein